MLVETLLISLGILGLLIATITDLRTREVPDYLNYFLIGTGFSFRIFHSILFNEWTYFLYGLLGFLAAFFISLLLYFTRQWGGGDAKLLMSLGVIFGTQPIFLKDEGIFFLNLLLNIFIAGSIYGLIYSIYLALKNKKEFKKEFKNVLNGDKIIVIRNISFIVGIISFTLSFFSSDLATKVILIGFSGFLIFYIYFWIFVKAVENTCMFKVIPVDKLTDGDWVVDDIYSNKKLIYSKNKLAVDKNDILRFIKEGVKKVKIKNGIPFVPSFLIGTILTLILGNLFI